MSWVAVALAIETIVNAGFFKGANGIVVGAIVAFALAGVNLAISFGGGVYFRGKNSINPLSKKLAWLVFILTFSLIIPLNLLTAAYRSASAELLSKMLAINPSAAVITNQFEAFALAKSQLSGIFDGNFPFADLDGVILLFVGLIAAVIGMWKGYTADDPYPGYGHISRTAIAAEKKYIELEKKLKTETNLVSEEPLKSIIDTRQNISSLTQQVNSINKEASDLKNEWQQNFSKLLQQYQSLIDVYRKAIKSVKPNAVPDYFNQQVSLEESESINSSIVDLELEIAIVKAEVKELSDVALPFLADSEQNINNERSTVLGGVITNYLNNVIQEARNVIASQIKSAPIISSFN